MYYIDVNSSQEVLPSKGKIEELILDGADEIDEDDLNYGPGIICVIDEVFSEIAVFVHSFQKYTELLASEKQKTWLFHEGAKHLSGFKKKQDCEMKIRPRKT